ncbi:hypothetical protein PL78_08800 [Yersinia entomophaga]|uniref:Prepilin peptidase dependent protein C-like C-terminal domain-containing protein n=1 Tax=Yersinia entomophaga TaxID=935293 RepID=A0ABM6BKI6_YERET|nr:MULTISPECIES: prepilin-type N-terminal cleavage/methylation domain-containing protein [Yersinia]ANI29915.1 hypothetical protein PL78_08800 [Yersinia entomophaga]OWF87457.1 hypothetical protein B4914_11765 [Yersinia entomophaga]
MERRFINQNSQQGLSLPEVMIAVLLLSVSLLGVLQYHQILLQGFYREWHGKQAWLLAQYETESFMTRELAESMTWPPKTGWQRTGWQHNSVITRVDDLCERLNVEILTPLRQRVELYRLYCYRGSKGL